MAGGSGFICTKAIFYIFNIVLWIAALGLIGVGLWMLLDPRRSYILDLVNFYEYDPLLRFAAFIFIGVGSVIFVVGIIGCCGAVRGIQSLLCTCCIILGLAFIAQLAAGIMAVVFREQMNRDLSWYFYDLVHNRYEREKWITSLVDTVQFYQKCCGSNGSYDYDMSYWQMWNNQRGAVMYIPVSCCTQSQDAYPPANLRPIDDRCQEFPYGKAPPGAVNEQGCYSKLIKYFNENVLIFMIVPFGLCLFLAVGMCLSICLCLSQRRKFV